MRGFSLFVLCLALAPLTSLAGTAPTCVDRNGSPMGPNDEQVLQWKTSTQNQYQDRGYIQGTLAQVYENRNGHLHIGVFIGTPGQTPSYNNEIEVIYNTEFGEVPGQLQPGAEVIACGDYITSTRQSGPYPPSPLGAILHWVHKAMNDRHPSGFLMIDGQLYGQMDAPPRQGHGHHHGGGNWGNNGGGNWGNGGNNGGNDDGERLIGFDAPTP